jgi:integrase
MEKVKKDNPNIKGYLDSDFTTKMGLESFNGMDGRNIIISWINQIQKPSKEREYGGLEFTQSKPTTIKSYYIVVRCFFNWLDRNGYIDSNPIKKITPQDLPHFSTYDRIVRNRLTPNDYDIECIWKWINDEIENPPLVGRWNKTRKSYLWIIPMIVVWMKTGIRNNTCCKLELKNVNWETGLVKYITKGSVGGVFYLDDTLRKFLKPLVLDENNERIYNRKYLFSSEYVKKRMNTIVKGVLYNKEKPYSPQTTSQYFNKITSEIKQTNENFNDEITIHSFRRYYINKSIRMGVSLSSIRKSINHNDYRSIMKYESDILDENELKTSTLPNPFETTNKDDELQNIHNEIDELKRKRDKLLNQQQTRKSI